VVIKEGFSPVWITADGDVPELHSTLRDDPSKRGFVPCQLHSASKPLEGCRSYAAELNGHQGAEQTGSESSALQVIRHAAVVIKFHRSQVSQWAELSGRFEKITQHGA
jgi:hypothetical protein